MSSMADDEDSTDGRTDFEADHSAPDTGGAATCPFHDLDRTDGTSQGREDDATAEWGLNLDGIRKTPLKHQIG
jgi:hypothetical protein